MKNIVGIKLDFLDDINYYYIENMNIKKNITVIVEDEIGNFFGKVVTDVHPIDSSKVEKNLGKVIRIATKKDYNNYQKNNHQASQALKKCKQLVKKYNLEMKILDAIYTFNQDQLIFHFYADSRIDFRELARDLASIYKTRIELRQIGVRDKAKKVGGVGQCGQKLCCARYLKNFDSVSISMAKNQNLSLNPNKINGICGRLLCCLKYEDDIYKEFKKDLPIIGQEIKTSEGTGKVVSVDILKKSYKVDILNKGIIEIKSGSN